MMAAREVTVTIRIDFLFGRSKPGIWFAGFLLWCGVPASWLIRPKVEK